MTKSSEFIIRLYFVIISIVTLITLMFASVEMLSIGLKTYVFTDADVPSYIETCSDMFMYKPIDIELTEAESLDLCESHKTEEIERYHREKANSSVMNLSLILISFPLFLLHFRIVYRDWKETQKK